MYTNLNSPVTSAPHSPTPVRQTNGKNTKASVDFARFVRETFEDAYGHPAVVSATARAAPRSDVVTVEFTSVQRDFARDIKRRVSNYAVLRVQDDKVTTLTAGSPSDANGAQKTCRSSTDPSLLAVLRSAGPTERFVEVWSNGALVKSVNVSDKHGDFYGDSTFGSLAWSSDNSHLVYAAEKPEYDKAKTESVTDDNDAQVREDGSITDDIVGGVAGLADPRRYKLDSDWGEAFNGKRPPALVVLNVRNSQVKVLAAPPAVSPGQAHFLPTRSGAAQRIVFTGYKHSTRKHGIVYCQNRPTGIFTCDLSGVEVKCLYSGSVRSPRLTPSGRALVFLSTPVGGPHASTSELVYYDLETDAPSILVPLISKPLECPQELGGTRLPGGFPGLYLDQLPEHPWLHADDSSQAETLAFTSTWRSTNVILMLDIQKRLLSLHTPIDGSASYSVLCTASSGYIVAKMSTPAMPDSLMLGQAVLAEHRRKDEENGVHIKWHHIHEPAIDANISWRVVQADSTEKRRSTECILVHPTAPDLSTRFFWPQSCSESSRPLVVLPHGGPHATYTLDYNVLVTGLVKLGFGVLLVNFTGSLGFGHDAVLAQIGKMDTMSIDEIQDAVDSIHASRLGDPKATVYMGGSYSGYTGALLAGLVPGFYRAIVLRNPVISIGDNAAMSDIPDWCWAELGLPYNFESPPELTPDVYSRMWQASPSRLVDKVRDPLLLLLGASDRRVPPPQSMSYYYRLKAANAPVECKIYPSVGHPLDTVEAERDSFVSILRFYAAALKK
ncbi:hypothetical protein GGH94_000758 [Coemansia aciculifera]|uniref:acylaminoacyl-peptidase n=1 Tax=Coemansia aciculifera TaxID=417176 RepID=A0A9W8IN59_9FUNG|nr:hypothetical protein GGH94_000758 [Coemansia aciculifera]KAJ2876630.1 hypothetical protein GGH93_000626 [Coemansia aciculifera]